MNNLLFILLYSSMEWGRIIGFILGIPFLILIFCYLVLAPFNLFFAFCKENRIMYIMTASGKKWLKKILFSSDKYFINKNTMDIEELTPRTPKSIMMPHKRSFFGMYWVGVPPFRSIYNYEITFNEWVWNKDTQDYDLELRKEQTPYLFIKRFKIGLYLREAENKEGFPLDVKIEIYLRGTNARTPIFDNADALGQLQTLLLGDSAIYVKARTFATIYSQKAVNLDDVVQEHDEFSRFLREINNKISGESGNGIEKKLGYHIDGAKILNASMTGEHKTQLNDAIAKAAVALETKKARITEGEAEAAFMDLVTEAKRKRYQMFKDNPDGVAIEIAEQKFKGNVTTYVEGNSNVTPTIPVK